MATIPAVTPVLLGGPTSYSVGDTAGNIINRAARLLGLAAVSDPFASTDENFIRLCELLTDVGRELERKKEWTHLQKEYSFVTVSNVATYNLPPDFRTMIDQSGWDRTGRRPLGGPLSPQEWQYLKGTLAGIAFRVLFRPVQQQIYVYPDTNTPGGYTIAFEYLSRSWVESPESTGGDKDYVEQSDDLVLFEPWLVIRALRFQFLRSKGFDSTAAEQDYQTALDAVVSDDTAAPILNLDSGGLREPLLGARNLPLTGYGS